MCNSDIPWSERITIRNTMRALGIFQCRQVVQLTGLNYMKVKGMINRLGRQSVIVKVERRDKIQIWKYIGNVVDNRDERFRKA